MTLYPGTIRKDLTAYEFPKLIYLNSRGKQQFWQIIISIFDATGRRQQIATGYWHKDAFPPNWYATVQTFSGQVGGKVKESTPDKISKGKNLGRSNATNPFTQAVSEASHLYIDHLRSRELVNRKDIGPIPTEIAKFIPVQRLKIFKREYITDFQHIYAQFKYDGVRAEAIMSDDGEEIALYSRRAEKYYCSAITRALRPYMKPSIMIDGELWADLPLQDITSEAKNPDKDGRALKFIIYDCYFYDDPAADQYKRNDYIQLFKDISPLLEVAPTQKINSFEELELFFDYAVEKTGHEGVVVRDFTLKYTPSYNNHQSDNYKYKKFFDDEFKIVDFTSGERGKAADLIMFICTTPEGKKFEVVPSRPEAWRREELKRCSEDEEYFETTYKGRDYTVQYATLTKDGIPSQPIGKVFE